MTEQQSVKRKPLSLYPLKFQEVIADVLKVKPEPKAAKKAQARPKARKAKKSR